MRWSCPKEKCRGSTRAPPTQPVWLEVRCSGPRCSGSGRAGLHFMVREEGTALSGQPCNARAYRGRLKFGFRDIKDTGHLVPGFREERSSLTVIWPRRERLAGQSRGRFQERHHARSSSWRASMRMRRFHKGAGYDSRRRRNRWIARSPSKA